MKYFAKINENGVVDYITHVPDDTCHDENGTEDLSLGKQHCKNFYGSDTEWVEVCQNMTFNRNKVPALGDVFIDEETCQGMGITFSGVFVEEPRPYDSWTLERIEDTNNFVWQPPIAQPQLTLEQKLNGVTYEWIEEMYQHYVGIGKPADRLEEAIQRIWRLSSE